MDVLFYADAGEFLEDAHAFLAEDPLSFSVILTNAEKFSRLDRPVDWPRWFATVSDESGIRGVAMRTHPDPPHAGFAARMPTEAVQALAEALAERNERVPSWNGDLDAARALCTAVSEGQPVEIAMHTRLFEARKVNWPPRPNGSLRRAAEHDEDLVVTWMAAFHRDADEQAGRAPAAHRTRSREEALSLLASRDLWIWEVDGQPVHLTGVRRPTLGTSRIGPVYTPPEHRGQGYAAWTVATIAGHVLDAGARPCLYTDQANPISNKIYERIGFEPDHDEANFMVRAE